MIKYKNGDQIWYLDDKRHRTDGPAIEYANGNKSWYLNGNRHRTDGPAIEHPEGYRSWFLNNNHYEIDNWLYLNNILSDEEKVMYKLKFG
jgi:hypothetical protein